MLLQLFWILVCFIYIIWVGELTNTNFIWENFPGTNYQKIGSSISWDQEERQQVNDLLQVMLRMLISNSHVLGTELLPLVIAWWHQTEFHHRSEHIFQYVIWKCLVWQMSLQCLCFENVLLGNIPFKYIRILRCVMWNNVQRSENGIS